MISIDEPPTILRCPRCGREYTVRWRMWGYVEFPTFWDENGTGRNRCPCGWLIRYDHHYCVS